MFNARTMNVRPTTFWPGIPSGPNHFQRNWRCFRRSTYSVNQWLYNKQDFVRTGWNNLKPCLLEYNRITNQRLWQNRVSTMCGFLGSSQDQGFCFSFLPLLLAACRHVNTLGSGFKTWHRRKVTCCSRLHDSGRPRNDCAGWKLTGAENEEFLSSPRRRWRSQAAAVFTQRPWHSGPVSTYKPPTTAWSSAKPTKNAEKTGNNRRLSRLPTAIPLWTLNPPFSPEWIIIIYPTNQSYIHGWSRLKSTDKAYIEIRILI